MKNDISRTRKGWVAVVSFFAIAIVCQMQAKADAGVTETPDALVWLDNGVVRTGVNMGLGGAITHVGPAGSDLNLVNNHDWGRQVQMSFYSGPVPYEPEGKKPAPNWAGLGWNPIQSGDCFGNRSQVLRHELVDGELHVVCRPMHWPLNNVPGECTFESWVALDGNKVRVRGRLNNARPDTTWYGAHGQELPAVYTNGVYYRLITYTGDQPFTQAPVERIMKKTEPGFPWKFWDATEHWAALLNEEDWGLGVVMPASTRFVGGFAGEEGRGGTKDAPTGYIAPLGKEELDHNISYDFAYVLVVGNLQQIREVAEAEAKPTAPPLWRFEKDRQSWTYADARDTGWPIKGRLQVLAAGTSPRLLSPVVFWKAEEAKSAEVRLANTGEERTLRMCWRRHGHEEFDEADGVSITIPSHEELRTYVLPLGASGKYAGGMLQLRVDFPGALPTDGASLIELESVKLLP